MSVYMSMGRTITTILVILLLIVGGFWLFGRDDGNLADNNNATTSEELTGTGGPEEGFDPLENFDAESEEDTEFTDKG